MPHISTIFPPFGPVNGKECISHESHAAVETDGKTGFLPSRPSPPGEPRELISEGCGDSEDALERGWRAPLRPASCGEDPPVGTRGGNRARNPLSSGREMGRERRLR